MEEYSAPTTRVRARRAEFLRALNELHDRERAREGIQMTPLKKKEQVRISDVGKSVGISNDFDKRRTNGNGEITSHKTEIQAERLNR